MSSTPPHHKQTQTGRARSNTPNLPTNIVDFGGFDSSTILIQRGWNSQAHRGLPGKFESSNVSRDNVSRRIGLI